MRVFSIERCSVALLTGALALLLNGCGGAASTATAVPSAQTAPASSVAGPGAQPPGGGAPGNPPAGMAGGITGTVTTIDGQTLRMRLADGSVVGVETTGNTAIQVLVSGGIGDLKVGDTVIVQGEKTGSTSYNAVSLSSLVGMPAGAQRGPAGMPPSGTPPTGSGPGAAPGQSPIGNPAAMGNGPQGGLVGTITAIAGATLTLQGTDGPVTVATTQATSVQVTRTGAVGDIQANDTVIVQGEQNTSGAYAARQILVQRP